MKCVPHPIVKFGVKINPFKFGHFPDGYQTGSFIDFYLSKKTHDMVRPASGWTNGLLRNNQFESAFSIAEAKLKEIYK